MALPKTLYVTEKIDKEVRWFQSSTQPDDIITDNGKAHVVGIYRLIKRSKFRKRTILESE
jgi:hypothetical protein